MQRTAIETYLTERSGFYTVEAWGSVVAKLAALALAGLCVWIIVKMAEDGGPAVFFAAPFILVAMLGALWTGLVLFTRPLFAVLRPANRFHRLRRADGPTGDTDPEPEPVPAPGSPRRRTRTGLLLVLSAPAVLVLVHILSAYAEELVGPGRFDWAAWGYSGIALDPLFAVTDRWPVLVLSVLVVSLLSLVALLVSCLHAAGRRLRARRRTRPADPAAAELPEQVVRATPRGQADLFWRTGLFLLLGLPSAFVIGYCLLAYLDHLRLMWSSSLIDTWAWDAPEHFGGFGEWLFTDEWLTARVLVPWISLMFLVMGIVLAMQAVPLLRRRGVDAIDLAVTESGVVTRGGLVIGWNEIAEVLVVRDTRITSWVAPRVHRGWRQPPFVLNPTYVAAHSRTRVALVLRHLPGVAARSTGPQRRGLRADRTVSSGYALCDLWVHSADQVSSILTSLEAGAERERVPVTALERATGFSLPDR